MSDVQKVLDQLTAVDAAIAAGRYGLQGEYRIGSILMQLAAALEQREPRPAPAPLVAHLAYPQACAHDRATPAGQCLTCGASLTLQRAVTPPPATSHAPTTCVHRGPSGGLCGELIRFTDANGWHHVSDSRLGASTHSATPQVPGPLPARPV